MGQRAGSVALLDERHAMTHVRPQSAIVPTQSELERTYAGRRVLVTGHTGFKGSWLTSWLADLGAEVTGFSLAPNTDPSMFERLMLEERCHHIVGDAIPMRFAAASARLVPKSSSIWRRSPSFGIVTSARWKRWRPT